MELHLPLRDEVGAYERDLAAALADAGYQVLNTVRWKPLGEPDQWRKILAEFVKHFPKLEQAR